MTTTESTLKTADLYDIHEESLQICYPGFRHYGGQHAFSGPIATLKCFEDNSLVREQLDQAGQGRILVVDAGGSLRCAMLGDILAQMAVDNGWAGIIMNGCIRDAAEIGEMPLGVMALATNPRKSVKKGVGEVGGEVYFAGVSFTPGEWLYADEDGIVVLDHQAT
ncbi:MAG: ribonuclease E activity regulator RraA [Candidatus Thiodiazotropha lotti]|uniref:4-hydroxy-4-methyl-2-oxoglutarate aldolase n=1 Tax=Candidatus Thiodiazotropha endoloripes TaxID=1818881 RepID=A0A1E2UHQ4_9GAMM|nr:ribonuclease E activity regulator RraA [Candidatus Thiodiazotropha endoloripes]MCG7897270.1 ribonuclease E activity regulator RraA [Candidatus Thiodiazotropha weberae]MCG7993056.1 ribonuclease E activity regulator RraA [Candidatus Thiodiazotropha lotti]MCG7902551.1 ribonuclease E activity regulator RraA [Candidatus Thiodiazotropha weberae]MCG7913585.1 ribonuclease E activity regulator RraA [Candidatus Thiodiazotropha weberae]MCG8000190.1 ribonuclease E activity regulator RraA [Candidatus Th